MATLTELRSLVASLSDQAEADLALLWAQFTTPDDVYQGLMDALPSLVDDYAGTAALVTAQWYDEYRSQQDIGGQFRADTAAVDLGAQALAGWGANLASTTDDLTATLSRVSGGLVKRVATASRETITENVYRDPRAVGWQRKARSEACGFCQMLAGRATVYTSRTTADFGAHDRCQCTAVPAFGGREVPVRQYVPTSRTITDADRARTRAWIKANL